MSEIELRGLRKSFGPTEVIKGFDLTIDHRERVVFVGPSGCGKSTLLRLICGIEDLSAGRIVIDGKDVTALPAARRGLAMVFQSYALYPHMTVRQNIGFSLRVAKTPKAEANSRIAAAADALRLGKLLDRYPRQLSGGQRQRVAIGRAIVREPKAFLFDEPLSNLDAALRVEMRLEINRLHESLQSTMVYVTHDQIEAMTLADRIVVLNGGAIEQIGRPDELYERPANRFVAEFIGSPRINVLPVEAVSEGLRVIGQAQGRPIAGSPEIVALAIRPEHLRPTDGEWHLQGRLIDVEFFGSESLAYFECGLQHPVAMRLAGRATLRVGQSYALAVDEPQLLAFNRADKTIPLAATHT